MNRVQDLIQSSLHRCQAGVAAVEFALIVPVLVLLLFGVVELSNILIADNKVRAVASSTADMITQKTDGTITSTDLTTLTSAITEIIKPLPTTRSSNILLSVGITNYRISAAKVRSVVWSRLLRPATAPANATSYLGVTVSCTANTTNFPDTLAYNNGTSGGTPVTNDVVFVEATYRWYPMFGMIFSSYVDLHTSNFFMPRYSLQLTAGTGISPAC